MSASATRDDSTALLPMSMSCGRIQPVSVTSCWFLSTFTILRPRICSMPVGDTAMTRALSVDEKVLLRVASPVCLESPLLLNAAFAAIAGDALVGESGGFTEKSRSLARLSVAELLVVALASVWSLMTTVTMSPTPSRKRSDVHDWRPVYCGATESTGGAGGAAFPFCASRGAALAAARTTRKSGRRMTSVLTAGARRQGRRRCRTESVDQYARARAGRRAPR